MDDSIPKELLKSKYRKEMWKNSKKIIKTLEKVLPISSAYLLGSFTTKKKRPADVDFIIMLKIRDKKQKNWSTDLVIIPDNKFGNWTLEDAKKWMKQKYGANKSAIIKLK